MKPLTPPHSIINVKTLIAFCFILCFYQIKAMENSKFPNSFAINSKRPPAIPNVSITFPNGNHEFKTCFGSPSESQKIIISGSNLVDTLNIGFIINANFEVSLDSLTFHQTIKLAINADGVLTPTNIFIRLKEMFYTNPTAFFAISCTYSIPTFYTDTLVSGRVCNEWTGNVSNDWSNAANWSINELPISGYDVGISASAQRDLFLNSNQTIGNLIFKNAHKMIFLGDYNLTTQREIIASSELDHIKTNGLGNLNLSIENTVHKVLPIGNSNFNPIEIRNNTGSTDLFGVRVVDSVMLNGSSGPLITSPIVNKTWFISKTNPNGGSGIDIKYYWNNGEISNGSLDDPHLNHYNGLNWEIITSGITNIVGNSLVLMGYMGTFSPFAIGNTNSALPTEMLSFTSKCESDYILLNWITSSERNCLEFIVEKSSDNISWNNIAKIPASGNSLNLLEYQFADNSINSSIGTYYYRLKSKDLNGDEKNYMTISSNCNSTLENELELVPNPTLNDFKIRHKSCEGKLITYSIYSSDGKCILMKSFITLNGLQEISVDLPQINPGIYQVFLSDDSGIRSAKIHIL